MDNIIKLLSTEEVTNLYKNPSERELILMSKKVLTLFVGTKFDAIDNIQKILILLLSESAIIQSTLKEHDGITSISKDFDFNAFLRKLYGDDE